VIEVVEKSSGRNAHYKLTSTVMLWLQAEKEGLTVFNLGGSMVRQSEKDCKVDDSNNHICNIGRIVEDMENMIRQQLDQVYFSISKNVVDSMRTTISASEDAKRRELAKSVQNALEKKGGAKNA